MPTPDGREWWTARQIAVRLGQALLDDDRIPQDMKDKVLANQAVALDVLEDAFQSIGYHWEHKVLRLTEKLKDSIDNGAFGPLTVPNSVGTDGQKIRTPVGEIALMFRDIYTREFLELFDEEGNML